MHPGKYDFFDIICLQLPHFLDDIGDGAAAFGSSGHCHYAKCASVTATVLDLDEGPVPVSGEQRCGIRLGGRFWHISLLKSHTGQRDEFVFLGVGYDEVNPQFRHFRRRR